jgi:hypothetical protein
MAKKPLPSPDMLRQLLRYDAETGAFTWREKLPDQVDAAQETTRVRIARNWNARFAGKPAFMNVSLRGYHTGVIERVRHYAHRVAWAMHHGEWPQDEIDHINGDRLDNRMCNLRVASRSDQMKNLGRQARNKTGFLGIWWDEARQNYQAYIRANGRKISLGRFATLDAARQARLDAEERFGFHANHGARPSHSSNM